MYIYKIAKDGVLSIRAARLGVYVGAGVTDYVRLMFDGFLGRWSDVLKADSWAPPSLTSTRRLRE